MIRFKLKMVTLCMFFAMTHNANASNEDVHSDIQKLTKDYLLLKNNSKGTGFDKWKLDQWSLGTISCAHMMKSSLPKEMKNLGFHASGSFSSIDMEDCKAMIESGPDFYCFKPVSYSTPFGSPPKGFMLGQGLFVEKGKTFPKSNSKVFISVSCQMVLNKSKTIQTFSGEALLEYREASLKTFNTSMGPKTVLQASALFKIDGLDKPLGATNLIKVDI